VIETWLRRLTSLGFRRGMRGSRPWMITGMIAIGLRGLRRMANPPPEVLYRTAVKPGDTFEIVARPAEPRKRRRKGQ
jgi:hypothetical protein